MRGHGMLGWKNVNDELFRFRTRPSSFLGASPRPRPWLASLGPSYGLPGCQPFFPRGISPPPPPSRPRALLRSGLRMSQNPTSRSFGPVQTHQINQLHSSDGGLPTTAPRAKRENGGLGEDPPGIQMTHQQVLRTCPRFT